MLHTHFFKKSVNNYGTVKKELSATKNIKSTLRTPHSTSELQLHFNFYADFQLPVPLLWELSNDNASKPSDYRGG